MLLRQSKDLNTASIPEVAQEPMRLKLAMTTNVSSSHISLRKRVFKGQVRNTIATTIEENMVHIDASTF